MDTQVDTDINTHEVSDMVSDGTRGRNDSALLSLLSFSCVATSLASQ